MSDTLEGRDRIQNPRDGLMHIVKSGNNVPFFSYYIVWEDMVIAMKEDHPIVVGIYEDEESLPNNANVGTPAYVRDTSSFYVYDIDGQWKTSGSSAPVVWQVIRVSTDVNPALPNKYYKFDALTAQRNFILPDPVEGCSADFYVELEKNTHKVRITTVSALPDAIQGNTEIYIPNVGGIIRLKCNGLSGYEIVLDTRSMMRELSISTTLDLTSGGLSHNTKYKVIPNPAGSDVAIILPPPLTYDSKKIISAFVGLAGLGSVTILRQDGGFVGAAVQQVITEVGASVEIIEGEGEYSIGQDSRTKAGSSVLELPNYRLTEDSDIAGYKASTSDVNDPRYGAEQLVSTPNLTDATIGAPVNYVSYITDLGYELGSFPAATIDFIATTRISNQSGNANNQRGAIAFYELYQRTSAGVETLLLSSSPFYIKSASFSQFIINESTPAITFNTGDRLVWKVWVSKEDNTGGIDPIIETKIEGVNGAKALFNLPSSLARHSNLLGLSDPSQHPAESIDFQTDNEQKTVSEALVDRLRPYEGSLDGTKFFNQQVAEDGYYGRVKVESTTDRVAPQEIGDRESSIPADTVWDQDSHVGVVRMENVFTYKQSGFTKEFYAGVSDFDIVNTITRITVENVTKGTFKTIDRPILDADVDTLISAGSAPVNVGDVIKVNYYISNTTPGSEVKGGWYASIGVSPVDANWSTDSFTNPTHIAISDIDADTDNRASELAGVDIGSNIRISETGDSSRFVEATVTAVNDDTGFTDYILSDQLVGGTIRSGKICDVQIVGVSAQPTIFDKKAGAYSTQPAFADITTALYFDNTLQAEPNTTGYRVRVVHQNAYVSPDYEYLAWPSEGGVSDGGDFPSRNRAILVIVNDNIDIDFGNQNDFKSENRVAVPSNTTVTLLDYANADFSTCKVEVSNSAAITFNIPSGYTIASDFGGNVWSPENGKYTFSLFITGTEIEILTSGGVL